MNLFLALAQVLKARGHQITFFGLEASAKRILEAGCSFQRLEPSAVPVGTLSAMMQQMSTAGQIGSMRLQGQFDELRYEGILSQAPSLVKSAGVNALIVDQAEACSGSVAEAEGLPWVSVCNGLCLNTEPGVPPFITGWSYSESRLAVIRNKLAYAALKLASLSTEKLINRHRKAWGLNPFTKLDDSFSPYAQIAQQVREFDFPRKSLPECFHYVGQIALPRPNSPDFPWSRLNGRPLIYASLGTVMNRNEHLYRLVAESCIGVDAQLVIALGDPGAAERHDLPGSPLVVGYAPQLELLGRAALSITHAGLNTTLESLRNGVPLVAIPITFEQPAIAARIRWTGTGDSLSASKVSRKRLRPMIENVLTTPSYRHAAQKMKSLLIQAGGADQAASIIEEVVRTGKPVLRTAD